MSILRAPNLGPIVGHTTDTSCKLWIRAKDSNASQVGVLKLMEINGKPPGKGMTTLYYFRLRRECNRIGIFDLGKDVGLGKSKAKPLTPDTKYKVCLATLPTKLAKNKTHSQQNLRKNLPNLTAKNFDDLVKFPEKGKKSVAVFRTFPALNSTPAQSLTFLLGSCHHPLSDSIFVPMDQQVCDAGDADRPRFVLMVGDQIYADECGWFSGWLPDWFPDWLHFCERAETYEEFQERYRTAFGSRYMRQLLRHVPTYMILDDHEIEDNWSPEHGKGDLFDNAIEAYENYQWSHGPCTFNDDKDDDKKFYYTFDAAGYPFFVLDTRTKRAKKKKDITKNDMLGKRQRKCLLDWLKKMQKERGNVPKFIVTSNVFVPNEKKERTDLLDNADDSLSKSDSWPAFPTTREAILNCIVNKAIQNVVFLSGDIHCSNVAKIKFTGSNKKPLMDQNNKPLKAFSITSSPFYSFISDGNDEAYVRNSVKQGDRFSFGKGKRFTMNYRSFFPFTANVNNFCRVKIDKKNQKIIIRFFEDDGDAIVWADSADTRKYLESHCFQMAKW